MRCSRCRAQSIGVESFSCGNVDDPRPVALTWGGAGVDHTPYPIPQAPHTRLGHYSPIANSQNSFLKACTEEFFRSEIFWNLPWVGCVRRGVWGMGYGSVDTPYHTIIAKYRIMVPYHTIIAKYGIMVWYPRCDRENARLPDPFRRGRTLCPSQQATFCGRVRCCGVPRTRSRVVPRGRLVASRSADRVAVALARCHFSVGWFAGSDFLRLRQPAWTETKQ